MMARYREELRRQEEARRRFEQRVEESCRNSGHARPKSRREFLNQGLIAGVGTVFLPSLATLLSRTAGSSSSSSHSLRLITPSLL